MSEFMFGCLLTGGSDFNLLVADILYIIGAKSLFFGGVQNTAEYGGCQKHTSWLR